jgi:hypothetical protein
MCANSTANPTQRTHTYGRTREEAIEKLNESLQKWVDSAMKGSFQFVITAMFACGCGARALSQTVQGWIESTSQVRNAPTNHFNWGTYCDCVCSVPRSLFGPEEPPELGLLIIAVIIFYHLPHVL